MFPKESVEGPGAAWRGGGVVKRYVSCAVRGRGGQPWRQLGLLMEGLGTGQVLLIEAPTAEEMQRVLVAQRRLAYQHGDKYDHTSTETVVREMWRNPQVSAADPRVREVVTVYRAWLTKVGHNTGMASMAAEEPTQVQCCATLPQVAEALAWARATYPVVAVAS